jgi:hypothetical protein
MTEQKRSNTRVSFNSRAEVRYGNTLVEGEVRNLSLKGVLIATEERIPEGEEVAVTIHMTGVGSQLALQMEAEVVRSEEASLGLKFTEVDLDTFIHLRNIVAYNEGDDEKIMNEFFRNFGGPEKRE